MVCIVELSDSIYIFPPVQIAPAVLAHSQEEVGEGPQGRLWPPWGGTGQDTGAGRNRLYPGIEKQDCQNDPVKE